MNPSQFQVLTPEQAQHFVEKGYVLVKGCLDHDLAKKWTAEAYARLGYDPDRPLDLDQGNRLDGSQPRCGHQGHLAQGLGRALRRLRRRGSHRDQGHGDRVAALHDHQFDRMVGCLHRQFPPRRRQAVDEAIARGRRLAQGRQLLPPLPRQPRAGAADHRLLVRRRPQGRRHLHRAGLDRVRRALPRRPSRGRRSEHRFRRARSASARSSSRSPARSATSSSSTPTCCTPRPTITRRTCGS